MEQLALPLELVIMILENLRGETATLKACTCVCREWAAVACPVLFRSLHLSSQIARGRDAEISFTEKLRDLKHFLDRTPTISGTIRELTLRRADGLLPDGSLPLSGMDFAALLDALSSMATLQHLTFSEIFCENIPLSPNANIVCTSVRMVALKDCVYTSDDLNHLSKVVSHLPNVTDVQAIRCTNAHFIRPPDVAQWHLDPVRSQVRLRSLTVTSCWPLAYWCNLHAESFQSLQLLSLMVPSRSRNPTDIPTLNRILRHAGENLLYLDLSLGDPHVDTAVPGGFTVFMKAASSSRSFEGVAGDLLAPCQSLRTFSYNLSSYRSVLPSLQLLADLLIQCTSSTLRHILIPMYSVQCNDSLRQHCTAWNTLQQACERHRALESVVFQVYPDRSMATDKCEANIREVLPELNKRGLLHFRHENWLARPRYQPM